MPQVEGEILRERGIETAIVAASTDRLDVAARHRAEESGLAARSDLEHDRRRAMPGRQARGLGNRAIENALELGEGREGPAILAANRRANGCLRLFHIGYQYILFEQFEASKLIPLCCLAAVSAC